MATITFECSANIWITYVLFIEYLSNNLSFGAAQCSQQFEKYNSCSVSNKSEWVCEAKS